MCNINEKFHLWLKFITFIIIIPIHPPKTTSSKLIPYPATFQNSDGASVKCAADSVFVVELICIAQSIRIATPNPVI